ncbi:MAG TPA: nitroreductase family protein [Anaeromyxobacteraceae bacterium]|nr:nitroreductase family protein [Anaeromyxobacteraceae bacterium]
MALIAVDKQTCSQCGLCARACPVGIIVQEDGFPTTVQKIEKGCITCGHCVAVCPVRALSHCRMTPDDCAPLAPDWRSTPERMEQLIKGRRSCRRFRSDPVDRTTLSRLLDIVRYAPTGMNTQSVRWLVLLDPAELQRVSAVVVDWLRGLENVPGVKGMLRAWDMGLDPILRNAPHLIVACGAVDDPAVNLSAAIAVATLELAAPSFGLGTCWAGFLQQAANSSPWVHSALELPSGCRMCGGAIVGYPEFQHVRMPARRPAQITWR